jgi:hypothetical protein
VKILEYTGLDTSRVKASYRKVADAIARNDFRAAQVKKLVNLSHGRFYRARLDDADRLLFSLVRHGDEVCALMLEVIANHDYDKSRFLRGAAIDESRILDIDADEAIAEAQPVRYLHPERTAIHLLDKPISFDDTQEAIYRQPHRLIVVGSAGSGKTALTLEKLKHAEGEVLYVTHSSYLAQSARDLYYANGFEHSGQEAVFLSYREFVESIRVPPGREASWRDFAGWFARMRQSFREFDGHQVFEEIRGVLAAGASGVLLRADYLALGVRQSIFPVDLRDKLYDLFEKYRSWLAEAKLYDLNLVAQDWQALTAPRYDFVVIDEVQDITTVQLALVLRTLEEARPLPALRRFEPDRASQLLFLEPGQEPVLERPEARRAAGVARADGQFPQRARSDACRQPVAEDQAPALRFDRPREQLPRAGGRRRRRTGGA